MFCEYVPTTAFSSAAANAIRTYENLALLPLVN